MSGSTIGGFAGAIVGSFFGNPQMGFMIGSMIGGYVDPEKIEGPRLTDAAQQTSRDGVPIPFGYGAFPTAGNVIWQGPLIERKKKERAKGGPEVTSYTYTRSYAIGICEGPIAGLLMVKRNGKVVYDARTDAEIELDLSGVSIGSSAGSFIIGVLSAIRAHNSKFINRAAIYLGGEDQLPDSTIEAVEGIGNVAPNRGLAYIVMEDDDLTDLQGAIPQYEFVVTMAGAVAPDNGNVLAAGRLSEFTNTAWPLADAESDYEYVGVMTPYPSFTAPTVQAIIDHFTVADRAPIHYLGFSAETAAAVSPGIGYDLAAFGVSNFVAQPAVADNLAVSLVYSDYAPDRYVDEIFLSNACPLVGAGESIQSRRGAIGRRFATDPGGSWQLSATCGDGSDVYEIFPLVINVKRKRIAPRNGAPDGAVEIPDAPGYFVTTGGDVVPASTYTAVSSGPYQVMSEDSETSLVDGRDQYTYFEQGPVIATGDPNYNNQTYWEARYAEAVAAGKLPAGLVYGVSYPATFSTVYQAAFNNGQVIDRSKVPLATIVSNLWQRAGLSTAEIDVSQLTDLVDGYRIASEGGADAFTAPLMGGYFFDCAEWDAKLRAIKRGGAAAFALGPEDFVERDGDAITQERVQEAELLRKQTVAYLDPAASYTRATQAAERRISTIQARGESLAELPVVMDFATAAKVADKRIRVAWAETDKLTLAVSYRKTGLTPTDVGTITDKAGKVQRVRLMEMQEDGGVIEVEAPQDRASVYTSVAAGSRPTPPPITTPGLLGPTAFVPMNLPALRSADNTPGAYVAVSGVLSGWRGCDLQMSVDGGVSYSSVALITVEAAMGRLTTAITAAATTVGVEMVNGAFETVTPAQISAGLNRIALVNTGRAEVGQAQTATQQVSGALPIYTLSNVTRGLLKTAAVSHAAAEWVVLLDEDVIFLPLDASLAGRTLLFKPVTIGTSLDATIAYPFTFDPIPPASTTDFTRVTTAGDTRTDADGNIRITD